VNPVTRRLFDRVWSQLRSESGDADPVLTIVSMFLSAMITAVVLGAMVIIIQFGSNFVTDQVRSTSLATAQKAWSQDAANASQVKVRDASQATFYEEPGYRPGVYFPRGDDIANQCRKSVWTVTSGVLTDVVTKFSEATCDLVTVAGVQSVNTTIKPVSTTTTVTLTGVGSTTAIVATNAAGRDLHYVAGVEIGLVTGSADPSTNTRASWWRDYEWAYPQPARINLVGKVLFPVSGLRTATLRGDTSIVPTSRGTTLGSPEIPPVAVVYDPAPLAAPTVTRSSTTGAIYPQTGGGVREGINVQFVGVSCGPYSTQYDISWATTTPGATPSRSVTEVTFDQPLPVDFDKVPNGAMGEVTVTASCPTSTKPSTVTSKPYTQPLPTPVLTATAGTPPNVHTLSWGAVTSLAAQYTTELSQNGSAFTLDSAVSPNPTTALTETVTYPLGSTYGVTMASRVTAAVGPTLSSPSAPKTVFTDWPFITPPALTRVSAGLLLNVTSDPASCPAGTNPEYSQTRSLNGAGTGVLPSWSTNPTVQYVLREGDQTTITGTARCAYNATQVSLPSGATSLKFTQPITTAPNPPVVSLTDPAPAAAPIPAGFTDTGCPASTTYEYRYRPTIDGIAGVWSVWSADTTAQIPLVGQGDLLTLDVAARCVSPYWNGPAGPPSSTSLTRRIPAPSTPLNIRNDGGGVSAPKNDRVLYDAVAGCPVGSHVEYRRDHYGVAQETGYTTALTLNVPVDYGTKYDYRVVARCTSPYISSPDSAWSPLTEWTTNVPAPSTPSLFAPGWAYVNTWFTVNVSGSSCPAPLALHYYVSTSGSHTIWHGSFPDYWPTTGTRWYTAVAYCQGLSARGADSPPRSRSILIKPRVAGYPGGPTAYNVQSGCPWPRGYTPQQNVGFRLNASNGSCYYQSEQPVRDSGGNIIVGQWQAWSPGDPGQWYANNAYTG
jgi:hypothetical protein